MTVNLWPKDLDVEDIKAPSTILMDQGSKLSEITANVVHGMVLQDTSPADSEKFYYSFFLHSPALGYKFKLFSISYSVGFYPVCFYSTDEEINMTLRRFSMGQPLGVPDDVVMIEALSEDSFIEVLRRIFQSERSKNIIKSIIAQVRV